MTRGIDLRLERVRHYVKQVELAAEMGLSHGRISHIELAAQVRDDTAQRYRDALKRILERREAAAGLNWLDKDVSAHSSGGHEAQRMKPSA